MKALIPAAGLGTRWHPWSKVVPKELIPLGKYPAIHFVLNEAMTAGIKSIGIVISGTKLLLKKYVEVYWKPKYPDTELQWFNQSSPCGVADALFTAKAWVKDNPVAVLYPDEIHPNSGGSQYILNQYKKSAYDFIGLTRKKQTRRQISFALQEETDFETYKLERANDFRGNLVGYGTGRYILKNGLIGIEQSNVYRHKLTNEELDDRDLFQSLWSQGFMGICLPDEIYDIGTVENWRSAIWNLSKKSSYGLTRE